jgi:hypothetical protein
MTKIIDNTTYVAIGSNWWGSGPSLDEAIKRVAREAKSWGSMAPKSFAVTVYTHEPDEYLYWTGDGETYLVDRETDIIKARAIAAHGVTDINPRKPLSTMRLSGPEGAYWKGAEAIALIQSNNEHGRAPIGQKVA